MLQLSINGILLSTAVVAGWITMLTHEIGISDSFLLTAIGLCWVGLLQQIHFLVKAGRQQETLDERTRLTAITWRALVALIIPWNFVVYLLHSAGLIAASSSLGYDSEYSIWYFARAAMQTGALCALLTSPHFAPIRKSTRRSGWKSRLWLLVPLPILANLCIDRGLLYGLPDVSIQEITNGLLEPVTVSSGAMPAFVARSSELTRSFVYCSIASFLCIGTALLVTFSSLGKVKRSRYIGLSLSAILSIPALAFAYWLFVGGYRLVAPMYWEAHVPPAWLDVTAGLFMFAFLLVFLTTDRRKKSCQISSDRPIGFLHESCFVALAMLGSLSADFYDNYRFLKWIDLENVWLFFGLAMDGVLPAILAFCSISIVVNRMRFGPNMGHELVVFNWSDTWLRLFVGVLVVLFIFCMTPFGVSLIHVGI